MSRVLPTLTAGAWRGYCHEHSTRAQTKPALAQSAAGSTCLCQVLTLCLPPFPCPATCSALDKSASRKPRKRYGSTVGDEAEEPLLGGDDEEGSPHLDLMGRTKEQLQGASKNARVRSITHSYYWV